MTKRDSFLLRIDPTLLNELKRWADAELRSTNAHIEYLLRKALMDAGRKAASSNQPSSPGPTTSSSQAVEPSDQDDSDTP